MRSLVVAIFATLGFTTGFSQVFWTETFSNQASSTTNWVSGGTNAGPEVWTWSNDPLAGFVGTNIPAFAAPTAADGYFYFNSDANGEFDHAVTLSNTGAPANCTGKTGVRLHFQTQYIKYTATAVAEVGVSTDGGATYTYHSLFPTLGISVIYQDEVVVDIPEADNAAAVVLQFRWTGNYEYHWKVDDIALEEYVAPANAITFRVNSSLITVDPAGMKIAGSFTNWADADMTNTGNGVWSYTAAITEGDAVLYKFKNGAGGWESGQAECGISDGFGGYNRSYTAAGDATLAAVCFNSCAPCQLPCELNPDAIICDKFDSYSTTLKLGPQATWWTTWSGTEGTTEDGIVSTEQAFSAPNSFKLVSTAAAGGPQDVVLNLGNKTAGHYALNWKVFVPTGKQAYYNIQNVVPIGAGEFNLEVFFNAAGAGILRLNAVDFGPFTYTNGAWVDVKHDFDLDNNLLEITIDGNFVIKMPYANNLGGIDFYGVNNSALFYVDNLEYIQLPAVVYNVDACESAIDLTASFGAAAGVVNNVGPYDITTATLSATDPTTGTDCFSDAAGLARSHWFTFTGDGNTYQINTTVDCGTLPDFDTQFALYTGSCGDFTAVDCNDDISTTDYRSTLTVATEPGVDYYLLVDAWGTGLGTYCLDIQQVASITCADGLIGANVIANDGFLCNGADLADLMEVDAASYVIPNQGPVAGHLWCISTTPLDPATWPGGIDGIASTGANPEVLLVGLVNDGSAFAPGVYYLTSLIVAGGTLIDPAVPARVFNIDPTNGCFFMGESHQITLLPAIDPIVGFAVSEPATGSNINVELVLDGGIAAALGDPSLYVINWSNGATTPSLTNVPNTGYTVTVSDPTGCVEPVVIDVTVGTSDPSTVKALQLSPNPTTGLLNVNLKMTQAADVQIEVVNTLGQTVETLQLGKTTGVNQSIDLSGVASGMYTIRVRMDNETAVRRVAVQH